MSPGRQFVIAALLIAFPFGFRPVGQTQSLAELAKQEKARRAKIKSRIKIRVLSNNDIYKFKSGAITTGVFGKETAARIKANSLGDSLSRKSAASKADTGNPEPAKDETYWRNRYKELAGTIKALENKSVLEKLQLNELRNKFFREQDGFFRETIQKDIVDKQSEIAKTAKQLQHARDQMEAFRRAARKNRVPPAWIRG